MTSKQIAGYLKARRDKRGSTFGGITFNDGYNVPTFGITKATYDAINRAMHDEYGTHGEPSNLTPAVVKKALKNHLERGGTLHHTPRKSPAQLQREIDEVLAGRSSRVSHAAKALRLPDNYEIAETIDGDWMILINGFQTGANVDRSGAGSDTYPSYEAAHEAAVKLARPGIRDARRYAAEKSARGRKARTRHTTNGRVHHVSHPTSTGRGVDAFWDIYEEELVRSIASKPEEYALGVEEPPEVYARRIRDSFQKKAQERGDLGGINMDSPTWKRLAKRVGVAKFSQGRLKEAYEAYKSQ